MAKTFSLNVRLAPVIQNVRKFKGFCNERKVRFECWNVSLMFSLICISIQTLAHTFQIKSACICKMPQLGTKIYCAMIRKLINT